MAEGEDAPRRKCFVIGQIGSDGTPERNDADWVLAGIVRPALEGDPFNYDVTRADEGPPGQISIQIVEAILDADLIVADLTGYNPNAFYELGIAHMAEKPVIHMMKKGNPLPFDNKDFRTLFWDRENPADLDVAAVGLAKHADAIDQPDFKVSNPITMARSVRKFSESADPREKVIADLIGMMSDLRSEMEQLQDGARIGRSLSINDLKSLLVSSNSASPIARGILRSLLELPEVRFELSRSELIQDPIRVDEALRHSDDPPDD